MNNEEEKEQIEQLIKKSDQNMEDVLFLITNQKYEIAVSRMYYSIFYILSALALKHNFQTSKHTQLIGWFNKTFLATGLFDKEIGKISQKMFEKRSKADYDAFVVFLKEEVEIMYIDTKKLIYELKFFISKKN